MPIIYLSPKSELSTTQQRILKILEKLPAEYHVWFDNGQRYTDFVILHLKLGLVFLELRDWTMSNVRHIGLETVVIGDKNLPHPLKKAQNNLTPIENQIRADKLLSLADGTCKIPFNVACIMSKWKHKGVKNANQLRLLNQIFPPRQVFFAEDLEMMEKDAVELEHRLQMLVSPTTHTLTEAEISQIKAHIFPEIIVQKQKRAVIDEDEYYWITLMKTMDTQQEEIARMIGRGHRVVHGVAGSGKTLILRFSAKKLACENPDKKILVICYSNVLARKLAAQLSDYPNIEVRHFHDLCNFIDKKFSLNVLQKNETEIDWNAYESIICNAIIQEKILNGEYFAVLIDEGQDFKALCLRAMTKLVDENQNLLLLYDDLQNISDARKGTLGAEKFSLSSVGISARGRTKILEINYRNSLEIIQLADAFIRLYEKDNEQNNECDISHIHTKFHQQKAGFTPTLYYFGTTENEIKFILNKLFQWFKEGVSYSDMAVIAMKKEFLNSLKNILNREKIPVISMIESEMRRHWFESEGVTLTTAVNSKGLEFRRVIIADMSHYDEEMPVPRLIYVAMTRAMEILEMSSIQQTAHTQRIEEILKELF